MTAEGLQTMAIVAGAILRDGDDNPVQTWNGSFRYDANVMSVVSTTPANGSVVSLPFENLEMNFDEPVDPSSIGVDDLTLSQGSVVAASMVDADTVRYSLSGITAEGTLTVSLAAGAVADSWGNPAAAHASTFTTDFGTVAFATSLTAVAPLGGLVYDGSATGDIAPGGDTDSFTLDLDAGQTLTALVNPNAGLRPTVSITSPGGVVLGQAESTLPGADVLLQTVAITTPGTYTVTVGGAGGTAGSFTLELTLNAAVEAENHGGASNDSRATAQDITNSFLSLGESVATRGAVSGSLQPLATAFVVDSDNFDAGPPLGPQWTTYSSNSSGQIRVTNGYGAANGAYALVMDVNSSGSIYNLNEAVWTVNLAGVASPTLTFSHRDWSDDADGFSGDFSGHYNADGVAISARRGDLAPRVECLVRRHVATGHCRSGGAGRLARHHPGGKLQGQVPAVRQLCDHDGTAARLIRLRLPRRSCWRTGIASRSTPTSWRRWWRRSVEPRHLSCTTTEDACWPRASARRTATR